MDTSHSLKLVVETVVNEHYSLVAMVLEVQALSEHFRLCGKVFQPSVLELLYNLVRFLIVLRTVDRLASGNGFAQFHTLRLQVVPQKEMVVLILWTVDNLHHTGNF